jgi:hypothetical protein
VTEKNLFVAPIPVPLIYLGGKLEALKRCDIQTFYAITEEYRAVPGMAHPIILLSREKGKSSKNQQIQNDGFFG